MNPSTASNRLKKLILFNFIQKLQLDICHQCGDKIENENELSVEHKIPWIDSEDPKKLFFDIDNISFSHLKCNISARRSVEMKHPSLKSYEIKGCRCDECKQLQANKRRKQRLNKIER